MCNTVTSWCWRGLLSFLILKLKLFNLYLYVWLDLLDLTFHFYKVDPPPMRLEVQVCTSSQSVLTHPRNCDGRFGVKWSRRGESVLRVSPPPERDTIHLRTVVGAVLREDVLHLPNPGVRIFIHPPPSVVFITKVFCHNLNIALSLCSSHHPKYLHVGSYHSSSTILFFWFYMFIFMCVCVCTCVYYQEKNIKSKKSFIVIIE